MEAIILAGGFGTRLAHIVKDVPKPMAPVNDIPFLKYIVDDLIEKGVKRILMAVGYKKECIIEYFGNSYKDVEIIYSDEDEPLLTGGAIKKALQLCKEKEVFVINGDTFFNVDLQQMKEQHEKAGAVVSIACKQMEKFDRYGTVEITEGRITGFNEKVFMESGMINGGIYLLNKDLLEGVQERKFSFEVDFMEKEIAKHFFLAYISEGYFIDIGVETDYYKAQEDFKKYE